MIAHYCFALLALTSLAASSDPSCEELVVPLTDRTQIPGKWIYNIGTSDTEHYLDELNKTTSYWMEVSPVPDTDNYTVTWSEKINGNCTFDNGTSVYPSSSDTVEAHFSDAKEIHVERYLKTCPDCLLLVDNMVLKIPNSMPLSGRFLYLLTKSGKVTDDQVEIFKKQAACLKFTKELHFGNGTDLCPEENI
ncbi:uncharacterized protein ACBT44_007383 [Syngnathus typhle]